MHFDSLASSSWLVRLRFGPYIHKSRNPFPSREQLIQKQPIPVANPLFRKIIHLFCDATYLNTLPINSFMRYAIRMRIFPTSEKLRLPQDLTTNTKVSLSAEGRQTPLVAQRSTFILQILTSYKEHVFGLISTLIHESLTLRAADVSKVEEGSFLFCSDSSVLQCKQIVRGVSPLHNCHGMTISCEWRISSTHS
jgi:hypothetical protein